MPPPPVSTGLEASGHPPLLLLAIPLQYVRPATLVRYFPNSWRRCFLPKPHCYRPYRRRRCRRRRRCVILGLASALPDGAVEPPSPGQPRPISDRERRGWREPGAGWAGDMGRCGARWGRAGLMPLPPRSPPLPPAAPPRPLAPSSLPTCFFPCSATSSTLSKERLPSPSSLSPGSLTGVRTAPPSAIPSTSLSTLPHPHTHTHTPGRAAVSTSLLHRKAGWEDARLNECRGLASCLLA
jgi:hypothetical protein